jgi:hypothetical protein
MNYEGRSGVDTSRRDSQYRSNPVKPPRCEGDCNLAMNMNRKGNLLTPALSSTSAWRRGRWNGACGFWGSMREIVRGILSRRRGDRSMTRGENPTKSNQIKPAGARGADSASAAKRSRMRRSSCGCATFAPCRDYSLGLTGLEADQGESSRIKPNQTCGSGGRGQWTGVSDQWLVVSAACPLSNQVKASQTSGGDGEVDSG